MLHLNRATLFLSNVPVPANATKPTKRASERERAMQGWVKAMDRAAKLAALVRNGDTSEATAEAIFDAADALDLAHEAIARSMAPTPNRIRNAARA